MILTRRVNNELGMYIVRNSLTVLDISILFQDFFVTFLLHWTYAIVSEVLRLITERKYVLGLGILRSIKQ